MNSFFIYILGYDMIVKISNKPDGMCMSYKQNVGIVDDKLNCTE